MGETEASNERFRGQEAMTLIVMAPGLSPTPRTTGTCIHREGTGQELCPLRRPPWRRASLPYPQAPGPCPPYGILHEELQAQPLKAPVQVSGDIPVPSPAVLQALLGERSPVGRWVGRRREAPTHRGSFRLGGSKPARDFEPLESLLESPGLGLWLCARGYLW